MEVWWVRFLLGILLASMMLAGLFDVEWDENVRVVA
jgi:hypothetical protein